MAQSPESATDRDAALDEGYDRLRAWYQANAHELAQDERDDSRASLRLIEALPPAGKLSTLEKRAVLGEVVYGLLEWGHGRTDGELSNADRAKRALEPWGGYRLSEGDLNQLRGSPLWPLLWQQQREMVAPDAVIQASSPPKGSSAGGGERAAMQQAVQQAAPPARDGPTTIPLLSGPVEILASHTDRHWDLAVDAFTLPAGPGGLRGGRAWEALAARLEREVAESLLAEFAAQSGSLSPDHPIALPLPRLAPDRPAPGHVIFVTAYAPDAKLDHVRSAVAAALRSAADLAAGRLAICTFGTGSGAVSVAHAARAIFETVRNAGPIGVQQVVIAAPNAEAIEVLRAVAAASPPPDARAELESERVSSLLSGRPRLDEVLKGRPLQSGEASPDVAAVHHALISLGHGRGEPRQTYDADVREAVSRFQTAGGLGGDGILGPQTLLALHAARRALEERASWPDQAGAGRVFGWATDHAERGGTVDEPVTPWRLFGGVLFGLDPSAPEVRFLLEAVGGTFAKGQDDVSERLGFPDPRDTPSRNAVTRPSVSAEAEACLDRAIRSAAPSVAEARHVLAALLVPRPGESRSLSLEEGLARATLDADELAERFFDFVRSTYPDEGWRRPGVTAPSRAAYTHDQRAVADSLNVEDQAETFARLLAAADVDPPLSLGLFGNWGSGKTFFMELVQQHVTRLTGKAPYVRRVAQIAFNAWHYTDAHLWANLALRVYEGLAETIGLGEPRATTAEVLARLQRRIHSSREAKERAERAKRDAEEGRQRAERELARLEAEREKARRAWGRQHWKRLLRVAGDEQIAKEIRNAARSLGMDRELETLDDAKELARKVRTLDGRFRAVWRAFGARFDGPGMTALSVGGVAAVVALGLYLPELLDMGARLANWDPLPAAGRRLTQLAAIAGPALGWVGRQLNNVSAVATKLEALQAAAAALDPEQGASTEELRLARQVDALNGQIQGAREEIAAADQRIAEAQAEVNRIQRGGLVYDFTEARLRDEAYTKQLGLIATIRRDFHELRRLLNEWQKLDTELAPLDAPETGPPAPTAAAEPPVERIILYIDDLDRCHPDRVVEVLQAVHLLLSLDLFVVVLAVDARWLERSLYKAYLPEEVAREAALGREVGSRVFSPQNYLEKIFQIPYSLPGMSKTGFETLVGHLIVTTREHTEDKERQRVAAAAGAPPPGLPATPAQPPTPVRAAATTPTSAGAVAPTSVPAPAPAPAGPRTPAAAPPAPRDVTVSDAAIFLEPREEAYLQALHGFVDTPRLAKRMVNIYRLLRVNAARRGFERFLHRPHEEFRAAMLLLAVNTGFPEAGGWLLRSLVLGAPGDVTSWPEFVAWLDRSPEPTEGGKGRRPKVSSPPAWVGELRRRPETRVDTLLARLAEIEHRPGVVTELEPYAHWASEVGRFSFHWHLDV